MSSSMIATWVQAVGSAGSLLAFAAWVGIAVINRRDEFEARFTRQAQTVAAWLDVGRRHDSEAEYVVCVANGGDAPAYRCEVVFVGLAQREEPSSITLHVVLRPQRTLAEQAEATAPGARTDLAAAGRLRGVRVRALPV